MAASTFQITLPFNHSEADLQKAVREKLGHEAEFRILKRSIDARQHRDIRVQYSLATEYPDPVEQIYSAIEMQRGRLQREFGEHRFPNTVVVGSGPGGIFCAYWLMLHGFSPVILEQGPPMRQRVRDMARFMKQGDLNPRSNICFGAGGAGTYSDGKLITRIRSPFINFVMATFVDFGASENIRYLYNPHLGSNRIRRCINGMLDDLQRRGADIRYDTRLNGFQADDGGRISSLQTDAGDIEAPDALFLAAGHSSRDTYALLRSNAVAMDMKEFAMGVRVEHPARIINRMQYGDAYEERYPGIETAQYRFAKTWKEDGRAVYSFCMCPGGYILNASTDTNGVVSNGMSNFLKSGRFSNSAVVVNVSRKDLEVLGFSGTDASLQMQMEIEESFRASVNAPGSSYVLPGQRITDFLEGRASRSLLPSSCINPVSPAPMHELLPTFIREALQRGFSHFDRRMRGFASNEQAQAFGVESRTSSPYRVHRDEVTYTSPTHENLYPVGEGAGYAGGITSAAVDGIRSAQAFIARHIMAEDFR